MKGHSLPGPNQRQSPAKQTHFGGTESEKGNIFTKKGREQRKINRYKRSETNIINKLDKAKGDWEDKKVKKAMKKSNKRLSKTSQLHQDVVGGKTVIINRGALGNTEPSKGEHTKSKSPAKCPLIAAIAPAVIGAMASKKKE